MIATSLIYLKQLAQFIRNQCVTNNHKVYSSNEIARTFVVVYEL